MNKNPVENMTKNVADIDLDKVEDHYDFNLYDFGVTPPLTMKGSTLDKETAERLETEPIVWDIKENK